MDERQRKLVRDYGPKAFDQCTKILDTFYYLPANALSVLTDEEWKDCAEAMLIFEKELYKVRILIYTRMEESVVELK